MQVHNAVINTVEQAVALHDAIVSGNAADIAAQVNQMFGGNGNEYIKVKSPADIGSVLMWFATYGKHGLSPLQLNTILTELVMGINKLSAAQQQIVLAAAYCHPDNATRASVETMLKLLGHKDMVTWLSENSRTALFAKFATAARKTAARKTAARKTAEKPARKTARKTAEKPAEKAAA